MAGPDLHASAPLKVTVNGCPPAVGRAVDGLLSQRPGGECDAAEIKTQQEDRKHPAEGLYRIV